MILYSNFFLISSSLWLLDSQIGGWHTAINRPWRMCLPRNSQAAFGSIYTFAWSNSVHNLITRCVKNYIFPLISSHLIFSLRLQFFLCVRNTAFLLIAIFFCRSQDCSGFSPTLLGRASWWCQSPSVTKCHIAPSGGVLEPALMNSQLVTAADQRRHILESSSRAGLQRARGVCTNSMPENRAYLGLAVKILYFFFFSPTSNLNVSGHL